MHTSCTVAGLLTNCETWVLNKGDRSKIERIELWALKRILNLPKTTPTPAIWHITGFLITSILIDRRQFLYLKILLSRPQDDWTKKMFDCLKRDDIGWVKQMRNLLEEYDIDETYDQIKDMTKTAWRKRVVEATERKNKERLIEMCRVKQKEKTKTRSLLEKISSDSYVRAPCMDILSRSPSRARVQIMSMYHMLDCAQNYKYGYRGADCYTCKTRDDENHRINYCEIYRDNNLYDSPLKLDFNSIYSDDPKTVDRAIDVICELWDLKNRNNKMWVQ